MSESGSNLRAFRFVWARQSLETGDKGSHPLPVATMEITPSTSKWCWRRKVAFGWDYSLVSAVCRRGSVTVDRSALARHIEIWEFAHLVFATTQSQVLSLGHTLLSKIMFASLWSCSLSVGKCPQKLWGEGYCPYTRTLRWLTGGTEERGCFSPAVAARTLCFSDLMDDRGSVTLC